jgi:hypothetical protein
MTKYFDETLQDKYFVPDLEDFYPGCEYEEYSPSLGYVPVKFNKHLAPFIFNIFNKGLEDAYIRVSFLTQKQVVEEGWKENEELKGFSKEIKGNWYHLKFGQVKLSQGQYKHPLSIVRLFNKDPFYIYVGQCRDINQFRNIIKYLGL